MPASRTQKEKATTPEGREVKVSATRFDLVIEIHCLLIVHCSLLLDAMVLSFPGLPENHQQETRRASSLPHPF